MERRILVCCGSGGVGKTTTAAVLALEARPGRAAGRGRHHRPGQAAGRRARPRGPHRHARPHRRRLARRAVGADARHQEHLRRPRRRATPPPRSRPTRILENRFYRNISGALSGTQEYMAMEKLYELHQRTDFDLVVVDTPADPQRARLHRRAAAAHPLPRPPALPHGHRAEPRRDEGGERGRPDVPAHGRQGGRRRGDRRRHRVLPGLRGHGGGLPRAGRRRAAAAVGRRDRVRAGGLAPRATRSRRRSSSPRSSPRPTSRCGRSSSTACTRPSATGLAEAAAERAAHPRRAPTSAASTRNLADFQLVAVARGAPPRRPGRARWRRRRWCACRSCPPTSTTSTASPTLGGATIVS